ncbi:ribosome-associated translation inhibitor RaiA [Candidatus Peregrinibacteria bacterium]|jgi:ribosomal subunit interface protein|nr:ribosome-associated translation inhibitor RaiA [Candidatus Peregrinibacteria bacterium]
MQIHTQAHGLKLTEEDREYIDMKMEKITTLSKRLKDDSSEIRVDIYHSPTKASDDEIRCTITLHIPKNTLRAESHGSKVHEALDLAKQKLIPQIEVYKEKFAKH